MSNESINKVYVVTQSSGSYEDYHVSIMGVFKNKEEAIKRGEEIDQECIPRKSQYPMSEDEFEELQYGRSDDDTEWVNRGGYSAEDFQRMHKLLMMEIDDYNECQIEEFELL